MSGHFSVVVSCCPSEEEKVWKVEGDRLKSSENQDFYSFDNVVQESEGGEELYRRGVSPRIASAVSDGHDLFIVAYGLPATGKTYTLFGSSRPGSRLRGETRGIVTRLGQQILQRISSDDVCRISASFFHIFEDGRIADLLDPRRRRLEIVEETTDTACSYNVESLSVHPVCTELDLARLTERANLMRNAGGVRRDQNRQSSSYKPHCSHAFMSLTVERKGGKDGEEESVKRSRIMMVDLAGHGIKLMQTQQSSTDTGITTLHQILTSLPVHGITATAPFFSKSNLTKLMKPCLGGQSEALIIGTVSLSESSRQYTQTCLKVLDEAAKIKNYCRHSVKPLQESALGKTLQEIGDNEKQLFEKMGLSKKPKSWRTGREQGREFLEMNGKKIFDLSSSCISLIQNLNNLESQILRNGASKQQQIRSSQPTTRPSVPLTKTFTPKPSPLTVSTSSPLSTTHSSSSSSLDSSSSDDDEGNQPSAVVSGPPPPPLRDIPHIIPNSIVIPARPPSGTVRPSSAQQSSLASTSQVSSSTGWSEAGHHHQRPSSPTGSSNSSSIRTAISSVPHSAISQPRQPRASLPPPAVRQLIPLIRPVIPNTLKSARPPLPPPPILSIHKPTPLLTSTPKKPDLFSVSPQTPGLPLSALPSISPSSPQPSTPGSLTPIAGSPAPSPSPSPSLLPRQSHFPPSHLPPLATPPASSGEPLQPDVREHFTTSSSSSMSLTDSDLSGEARDTFDPVMRNRALPMRRNSVPYGTAPAAHTPTEEAPPYETIHNSSTSSGGEVIGVDIGSRGGGGGGGGGGGRNMNEYTSREEIHTAAMEGVKSSQLKKLAIQYGVDYRDHGGRTPLMYAVLGNQPRMCDTLLGLGAKVNAQDGTGLTPLLWATFQAKPQCMKTLLKHGADIYMRDSEGRSVFHWAVKTPNINCLKTLLRHSSPTIVNTTDKDGLTPLHWAVLCNQPSHVHLLLTGAAADVNVRDSEGRTALTHAVLNTSPACIKTILEVSEGAVSHCDEKGRTALHYACAEGSTDCVRILISSHSCDAHCRDRKGTTPLHWAAAANKPSVVQLLLRRGVDRSLKDNDGMTAVDHAEVRGHTECASILHNYGLRRPSSALSLASQVSGHGSPPPRLDEHGHISLSLSPRRFSLSSSFLTRPPADGQAHTDDSLSDHTHHADSHTQPSLQQQQSRHDEMPQGRRRRRQRVRELLCGCSGRRTNVVMPEQNDVT